MRGFCSRVLKSSGTASCDLVPENQVFDNFGLPGASSRKSIRPLVFLRTLAESFIFVLAAGFPSRDDSPKNGT